jgi:hypothetical protein
MASVINAATSPAALIQTSDGTAVLKLQTGDTDVLVLDENQNVTVNNGLTVSGTVTAATGSFTTLNTSGAVVFNDAGADVDFRVEGDTDANLLFVDASTDRVGIGTSTPVSALSAELPRSIRLLLLVRQSNLDSQLLDDTLGVLVLKKHDGTLRLRELDPVFVWLHRGKFNCQ